MLHETQLHNAIPHNVSTVGPMRVCLQVATKELQLFLASSVAWLFFAAFAAITLFVFFWGEAFFARNISDVRPMFEWMPILLIILGSTLTMRMWSEERRTGTLEHVLTQPAPLWSFVVGKFLGCMALLCLAMFILLPLPITLSFFSEIDWGPVWAGYFATFALGSAYIAIGLFVSSRTQNQIVSFIGSVFVCGIFWIVGHSVITGTVGQAGGELLQNLGTATRFTAITRGVIDVSDLVYYVSLALIFLTLTVYVLERERWTHHQRYSHHRKWQWATALLVMNAVALNLWVGQVSTWRVDTTAGKQYTLSDSTRNYLAQLQEPLTLRGYFSAKTHPLLSPLVPQMRDLLREYEVAGEGRVRVEFVDPMSSPEAEEEANQQYGIEPNPFQVADRYQSSIVSSYFNVLVQYGDEFEVLGFRDLIDVKSQGDTDLDVQLRNPEYDITKSIRRVITDFQSAGDVFASIAQPVTLQAYISSASLPEALVQFREDMEQRVSSVVDTSQGKLNVEYIDPDADSGAVAQQLAQDYGFRPMRTGLFSDDSFWFHLLLNDGQQLVQLPLDDLDPVTFQSNLDAGLKRFAKGFTKKLALVAPPGGDFRTLTEFLSSEYDVVQEDLADGSVASDVDLVLLAAPRDLDEKSLFAVDQFLMQGGTVIAATSPYSVSMSRNTLDMQPNESGLTDWLAHHGLTVSDTLVMDPQNAAFPAPVSRNVGGMQIQEMRMLDYPYFVDVRRGGMSDQSPIAAGINQVTMAWPSPISLADKDARTHSVLLESTEQAWVSESTNVLPRLDANGQAVWNPEAERGKQVLAVNSQGRFDSYFADRESPLLTDDAKTDDAQEVSTEQASDGQDDITEEEEPAFAIDNVIERSPESARIILFASSDFLRDQVSQMTGAALGSLDLSAYQLVANAVDVALDDTGLLNIRSRGQFNRTLPPMDTGTQRFWEYLNYALAALAIAAVYAMVRLQRRSRERQQLAWLTS